VIELKAFERSPHLAELKVVYRRGRRQDNRQTQMPWVIVTPSSAENYLRSIWNKDTIELVEDFILVCLNNAKEVLGWVKVSTGGLDSSTVDPRVVFGIALQTAAASIIIAHNHPSGSLKPSPQDEQVTKRLKQAGELMGIQLLDHLIITKDAAFSFADKGLM
jgi:DNA repair protein RadC